MAVPKRDDDVPDVGIIVGRFQVPDLHDGHRDVIDYVCDQHDKVIVFLGVSPIKATAENPLDFQARRQMLEAAYPERLDVLYINDMNSDELWSRNLDDQISHLLTASQTALLYGGRDSFISHYSGKHPTQELEAEDKVSGTEIRKEVGKKRTKASVEWREGATWSAFARFPATYPTVDIAIFNEDKSMILLGRKPHEDLWRLPGGFAEPTSESFEQDARREAEEETNLSITDPEYIGSFKIDDWRYRGERDKIKTLLFRAKRQFGEPKAGDDLDEVKWFDVNDLNLTQIMPNHRILLEAVVDFLTAEQKRIFEEHIEADRTY